MHKRRGPETCMHYRHPYALTLSSTYHNTQVIADTATGRSKGYGFVRFAVEAERDRALNEMNGG